MQLSQQVGDFIPTTKQVYQETQCDHQEMNIYIHKLGFTNVIVRVLGATKKPYCWRIKQIQVTQYANQFGAREKAVAIIEFDGEMIFSLIHTFNEFLGKEILEYVQSISSELRRWCAAPIKNIFKVTERTEQSLGFKHGFVEVTPILHYLDRYYYFQCKIWSGNNQQELAEIQNAEHMQSGTSSYSMIFQDIIKDINNQKQQLRKKYEEQKQLQKQKRRRLKKLQQKKRQKQEEEKDQLMQEEWLRRKYELLRNAK